MASDHVFRHPAFALFWSGKILTTIARLVITVSIGWQVYSVARLTHSIEQSSFLVGMVGLAQFLPLFALTLIAGETADRYERRRILLCCTGLQFCCAAALIIQAINPHPPLVGLFITAAFYGVATSFSMPAGTALAPMLVPKKILTQAIAWNTLSTQGGMILGPWIGGMLCAIAPLWAFIFAGSLYLTAGVIGTIFLMMKLDTKPQHSGGSRMTMIREGLRYLWHSKIVLGAISLDLFAVLLGGVTALLPVYARDILQIGADGFGLLRSGPALGGGIVTLILTVRPVKRHAGPWMLLAVSVFGVATIVFAVSKILWLSMAMLVILGAADSISVFVRQSLVQIVTPDHMRGRVSAVSALFIGASNELGEFESGVAARFLGPVVAAVMGGAGSIFITMLWAKLFPALRKADRLQPPEL